MAALAIQLDPYTPIKDMTRALRRHQTAIRRRRHGSKFADGERLKHHGSRIPALERMAAAETRQVIDRESERKLFLAEAKRRRRVARQTRLRLVSGIIETRQVRVLEEQIRERSAFDLVILSNPEGFETRVEQLAADPEVGSHATAVTIEQCELAMLGNLRDKLISAA
jgi:hypothetical protein